MSLSPRRRLLLDTAIEVLADEGLGGLTHRAVDRRAGLPLGTCSAYFRTRSALQVAVARRVTAGLLDDVEQLADRLDAAHGDHAAAVRLTAELFEDWLTRRSAVVARLELTLEAARDPDLAEALRGGRARLIEVVERAVLVAAADQPVPGAATLVAALDGVLIAAFLRAPDARADFLRTSVDDLIGPRPDPDRRTTLAPAARRR